MPKIMQQYAKNFQQITKTIINNYLKNLLPIFKNMQTICKIYLKNLQIILKKFPYNIQQI